MKKVSEDPIVVSQSLYLKGAAALCPGILNSVQRDFDCRQRVKIEKVNDFNTTFMSAVVMTVQGLTGSQTQSSFQLNILLVVLHHLPPLLHFVGPMGTKVGQSNVHSLCICKMTRTYMFFKGNIKKGCILSIFARRVQEGVLEGTTNTC